MPRTKSLPENVVRLPVPATLSLRGRAELDLFELIAGLDTDSQRVLLDQLEASQRRVRRHGPVGALIRGERGPVVWRRSEGTRWLVAPPQRRAIGRRIRA